MTREDTDPGASARAVRQKAKPVRFTLRDLSIIAGLFAVGVGALFYLIRAEILPVSMTVANHIATDDKRHDELKDKVRKNAERVDSLRESMYRIEIRQEAQTRSLPRHIRESLPPVPELPEEP